MLELNQILQDRYQLQQQLGRTGAGRQTWLALDQRSPSSEPVILKLLAFSPQLQWEEFKLFEREAQVLKNLNHPRIPQYRDYFSIDSEPGSALSWFVLVQDYIAGSTLQDRLDQGQKFTESEVRHIAQDLLEILIYLHELSPPVLHRDIKPSNLILAGDRIYLVDFGAVQDRAAVTGMTFTIVGTSGYAPLEQFWGKAVPASDLYALGATLIHLLTGIPPAELIRNDLKISFTEYVSLSSTLVNWIQKLTELNLQTRYRNARQALSELQHPRITDRSSAKVTNPLQQHPKADIPKVYQPPNTHIQINQSSQRLEIFQKLRNTYISIFAAFFCTILFAWFSGILGLYTGLTLAGIGAVLSLSFIWNCDQCIIFDASCDRFQIKWRYYGILAKLFGDHTLYHQGPISSIRYIFTTEYKGSKGSKHYWITIQAGKHYSCEIRWLNLRQEECDWLVYEIQNWMNRLEAPEQ